MEIAILLLVIVPLTSASPLRASHRTQSETLPSQTGAQALEVTRSRATQGSRIPQLRIIPFHSEEKHQDMDALRSSIAVVPVPRSKRSPTRGCQLGTCQLHNLANTLYQIGKTSGKEESKNAHDPQGYGR